MSCARSQEDYEGPWWGFPPLSNALIAGLIAGAAWVLYLASVIPATAETVLYWIAIPVGAWYWAREGLEELFREKVIGIEILMLAATLGSGILGLWEEAAALVILYAFAEGVEELTFARTRRAIRALLDLAPKTAHNLDENGETVTVPADTLKPGDRFVVRPGESVPTDGVIVKGESSLDESPVTGESMQVDKGPGDKVFAASINGPAALVVEATATFADNTLSRIIRLVEEAQDQKGRAQQWMERFGRRYSPAVLITAIGMLIAPWVFDLDVLLWSERAVVLLVAAAPCALVISLPIAMSAGISGAGKRGILIKGGAHLEHLGVIRTVAFDKTGTLTHGKPRVTDLLAIDGDEATLLAIAAGLEQHSEHPLAWAIRQRAEEQAIAPRPMRDTKALTGAGVKGREDDTVWYLGKPGLFENMGLDISPWAETIRRWQEEAKTVVLVGTEARIVGILALQDVLRENAPQVIAGLHALGIRTVMLTGDNEVTARRVARQLGIDDVRAGLRPEDKVAAVQELLQSGPVLMVGDGVNDAPALAAATCGMAMGAAGTDAAIEAADIALMADDLAKLLEAMRFGHKARRVSYENIVFAILVLVTLIPAGVLGYVTIATAVLVHEASELLAVANGLRAGRL